MARGCQARVRQERGLKLCPKNIQVSYEQIKHGTPYMETVSIHSSLSRSACFSIKHQRLNYLWDCPESWCGFSHQKSCSEGISYWKQAEWQLNFTEWSKVIYTRLWGMYKSLTIYMVQFQLIRDTRWQQRGWTLPDAVNTVKCFWWWAKTSSETCTADLE